MPPQLFRNFSTMLMHITSTNRVRGASDDRGLLSTVFAWHLPPTKAKRPTAWLDGLRGVAAFEVLIFHYTDLWVEGDPGYGSSPEHMQLYRLPILRTFWNSGRCMVCTFFIISGYVLTQRSLLAMRQQRMEAVLNNTSSAIFRRGIRLFPPALIICVIGFVLVRLGFRGSKENEYLPYFDSFSEQLWHFLVETFRFLSFFSWSPRTHGGDLMHKYEAVVWSIPMEFIGSMAIYVIVIGTARLSPTLRNACIASCALYGLSLRCWSIFCFYSGILAADLHLSETSISKRFFPGVPKSLRTIFFTCVLVQGFWMAGAPQRGFLLEGDIALGFNLQWSLIPERVLDLDINYTGWSIAGLLMLCSIPHLYYARTFLETGFCQYLGKISFALYLNHVWTRDILGPWLKAFCERLFGAQKPGLFLACLLWWTVMISFNFVVAGMFEKMIDRPLVQFAKDLEAKCVTAGMSRDQESLAFENVTTEHEMAELLPITKEASFTSLEAAEASKAMEEKSGRS